MQVNCARGYWVAPGVTVILGVTLGVTLRRTVEIEFCCQENHHGPASFPLCGFCPYILDASTGTFPSIFICGRICYVGCLRLLGVSCWVTAAPCEKWWTAVCHQHFGLQLRSLLTIYQMRSSVGKSRHSRKRCWHCTAGYEC